MIDPKILYEDHDIVVIDKPAGVVVNQSDTSAASTTVQEWARDKFKIQNSNSQDSEFESRGGVVHRLDKETSGILILAKNEEAFTKLQSQFKDRTIKKTYIALCHGKISPQEGEIDVPIGRLPWNRTKFGMLAEGRESKTLYKVLSYKKLVLPKEEEDLSLVEVYPQTGRTHQIRVHMRHINHPIFSDELYAGRKMSKRDRKLLPRHFLHANKISFLHPVSGERISLEAELPKDLNDFLEQLKAV